MLAPNKYCAYHIDGVSSQVCCREVWTDGKCIVHARVSEKPHRALERAKGPGGRLNGLYLENEYFDSGEIFHDCQIHRGTIVDCEFNTLKIKNADLPNSAEQPSQTSRFGKLTCVPVRLTEIVTSLTWTPRKLTRAMRTSLKLTYAARFSATHCSTGRPLL